MRPLPVLAAALVAALGVGAAVAIADTTATFSACSTTPGHTLQLDGNPLATIPENHRCVTTTYTVPTVTNTVTVTTSVTTSTTPSSNVMFDGSAKLMSQLSRTDVSDPVQNPAIWTCLCFTNNDISLAADPTYGKAYKVAVPTGDTDPWGGSSTLDGAGQLSIRRVNDFGKWDYFGIAVKVPAWNGPIGDLHFVDIASLGYQTSEGDQVALRLWNGPQDTGPLQWSISQNAGYVNSPTKYQAGTTSYEQAFKTVTLGQWEDFVIAVKWTTDTSGEVQVYNRVPGGSWSKVFDKTGVATQIYGTTTYGTFPQNPSPSATVIDKIGLYFQEYGGESETVLESGLTRSSSLAAAEATLP